MSSSSMKNNDVLIGAALIIGALYYSRKVSAAPINRNGYLGQGSMPGNVGTGSAQVVGGIFGALGSMFGKSTNPITSGGSYYDYLRQPNFLGNQAKSEMAWDASSPDVFVPGSSSTTGEDQNWTVG